MQRRIRRNEPLLRQIQVLRNHAAHAAINGEEREISETEYMALEAQVTDFLTDLFHLSLGLRAARVLFDPKAVFHVSERAS